MGLIALRIGNKVDAAYVRGNMTVTAMKVVHPTTILPTPIKAVKQQHQKGLALH